MARQKYSTVNGNYKTYYNSTIMISIPSTILPSCIGQNSDAQNMEGGNIEVKTGMFSGPIIILRISTGVLLSPLKIQAYTQRNVPLGFLISVECQTQFMSTDLIFLKAVQKFKHNNLVSIGTVNWYSYKQNLTLLSCYKCTKAKSLKRKTSPSYFGAITTKENNSSKLQNKILTRTVLS